MFSIFSFFFIESSHRLIRGIPDMNELQVHKGKLVSYRSLCGRKRPRIVARLSTEPDYIPLPCSDKLRKVMKDTVGKTIEAWTYTYLFDPTTFQVAIDGAIVVDYGSYKQSYIVKFLGAFVSIFSFIMIVVSLHMLMRIVRGKKREKKTLVE